MSENGSKMSTNSHNVNIPKYLRKIQKFENSKLSSISAFPVSQVTKLLFPWKNRHLCSIKVLTFLYPSRI